MNIGKDTFDCQEGGLINLLCGGRDLKHLEESDRQVGKRGELFVFPIGYGRPTRG